MLKIDKRLWVSLVIFFENCFIKNKKNMKNPFKYKKHEGHKKTHLIKIIRHHLKMVFLVLKNSLKKRDSSSPDENQFHLT